MTDTFFSAAAASGESPEEVITACLAQLGKTGDANLGFVYVTDPLAEDFGAILARLRQETGIAHWTGSVGSGLCSSGREIYDVPALSILIGRFDPEHFRILPAVSDNLDAALEPHQDWRQRHHTLLGVVHGDPRNPKVPALISALSAEIESGFLVGGLTSSDHAYYQVADELTEGGLSGVLFSDQVSVATGLTQGCSPIGQPHEITECERNVIVAIDGRPALEVFREEIGEMLSRNLNRVAGYIFAGLPVRGSDTGDYLVRNLVGIDPQQNLLAIGDSISEGDPILFCKRDSQTARDDMLRMLEGLKNRVGGIPKAGIYYTCMGRGRHLFGDDSEELQMIRETFGDFPLTGFFANGEISHNRLYGYTGVLTLFL